MQCSVDIYLLALWYISNIYLPCGSVDEKRCSFSQDFVKYFDIYVLCQVDIHSEYDLVQLIGEGWYSRVYLAEHRTTRDEVVLKAINSNLVTADEFCREYQSSINLWPHKNILKVKVVNEISRSTFFWRSHLLVPSPF